MDNQNSSSHQPKGTDEKKVYSYRCFSNRVAGVCLIILGAYFLAKKLGWIDSNFPFWALFLIVIGISMIFSRK